MFAEKYKVTFYENLIILGKNGRLVIFLWIKISVNQKKEIMEVKIGIFYQFLETDQNYTQNLFLPFVKLRNKKYK